MRAHSIAGKRLLVVEDNYLVADTLCRDLRAAGAIVLGPCPTADSALALLEIEMVDTGVLDVQLRGEPSYAVADALADRGLPFVFVTGYDTPPISARHANAPSCAKPVEIENLIRALSLG